MKTSPAKKEAQAIPEVVGQIARSVMIRNIQFMRLNAAQLQMAPGDVIADLAFELGGNAQKAETPPGTLVCFFAARVTGKTREDKPVARVSFVVGLAYEVTDLDLYARLRKEDIVAFAQHNGIRNAWPYMREVCQSLSMRLGVTPILLPVFDPKMGIEISTTGPDFSWTEEPSSIKPSRNSARSGG